VNLSLLVRPPRNGAGDHTDVCLKDLARRLIAHGEGQVATPQRGFEYPKLWGPNV